MKIIVTKRTEIDGAIIESTVSATTDEYGRPDDPMLLAAEEDPAPTNGELAAEIADKLFASISRSESSSCVMDENGNAVLMS